MILLLLPVSIKLGIGLGGSGYWVSGQQVTSSVLPDNPYLPNPATFPA